MSMNKLLQLIAANGQGLANRAAPPISGGQQPAKRNLLVRNAATPAEARLYVYDVITPWADDYWGGISVKMMMDAIALIDDPANTTLHVHFNSPGGDVFEGRAMRTLLKGYAGPVLGHIDALAASAATTVADGCDSCDIAQGAFFMIHNSWTLAYGDKEDIRKTADLLDKIDQAIAADYQVRTGADAAQVASWMDEETWFSANEAVDNKFCSAVVASESSEKDKADKPASNQQNAWSLSAYARAPEALTKPASAPTNTTDDADKEAAAWSEHVARRMALVNLNLRGK
jgi:ATP-dependent Clp protease protease subunit